jgi:hypothetical protein
MNLQEKLDAFKKNFEKQVPPEALKIMHRATDDLRNSGIMDRALKVGDMAPDFTLRNSDGQDISLNQLLSKGPVILSFYRGRW